MENEDLEKVKKIELEIMDYFDDFTKSHNLTYYIMYGTLLGAVRHKGFIPWDDDIDVAMMPDDYLKLLDLEKEINPKYYLQNVYNTDTCTYIFSKIRKYHTTMVEKDLNYLPFKKGINIDIFPLFKYPKSKYQQFLFKKRIKIASLFVNREMKPNNFKGKIICLFLHMFTRRKANKIARKNINKLLHFNKEFIEYRMIPTQSLGKDWFKKIELPFEGRNYFAPSGYEGFLKMRYGDYMKLPPVNERYGHGKGKMIIDLNKDYDE